MTIYYNSKMHTSDSEISFISAMRSLIIIFGPFECQTYIYIVVNIERYRIDKWRVMRLKRAERERSDVSL